MTRSTASRLHDLLTSGDSALSASELGRAYQAQCRRVRELLAELEAVAPARAAEWKQRNGGEL